MGLNAHKEFLEWEAKGVATPLTKVEVGKSYKVLCAWIKEFGGWVPLIPFKHSDEQLGLEAQHYHYDSRFMSPHMEALMRVDCGRTGRVANPFYLKTKVRRVTCFSTEIGGLPLREKPAGGNMQIVKWFKSMEGRRCAGRKWPHYGTPMVDRGNGLMECPLHGLFGDTATGRIIPRKDALKRLQKVTS